MIGRLALIVLAAAAMVGIAMAGIATAAPNAGLALERVVIVQRHGVRPPIASNQALAAYSAKPWPAWQAAPGDLTPHGGETVSLVGRTLRRAYRDGGLLPGRGCPAANTVSVWADGADERTQRSGEFLAEALAPGCSQKAAWASPLPRDQIFDGDVSVAACRLDPEAAYAALQAQIGPGGVDTPETRSALKRLQAILAPTACAGGPGTCFQGDNRIIAGPTGPKVEGSFGVTASLAEDLLLEYAEGMPRADVGWGRAGSASDIAAVMPLHERFFTVFLHDPYRAAREGAPLGRLILAALAGETRAAAPGFGPETRVLALAGHDSNLALMAGVFGLTWVLPGEPDATAPSTALAFELWRDKTTGEPFVRPVIYYATLDQLRSLSPATARHLVLTFADCASGPMASCPLETLQKRTLALIPPDCGQI